MSDFQATQPKEKMLLYYIPGRPREYVGADKFTINNNYYLCAVDYHSRFPVIKQAKGFSTHNLKNI